MKRKLLPLVLFLILLVPSLSAQHFEITLEQKITNSSLIIEGEVVESTPFVSHGKRIYTSHKVLVNQIFYSAASFDEANTNDGYIYITTRGGRTEEMAEIWSHALNLYPGYSGVFFLTPSFYPKLYPNEANYEVYAEKQGFIKASSHPKSNLFKENKSSFKSCNMGGIDIESFTPITAAAGLLDTLSQIVTPNTFQYSGVITITGCGFDDLPEDSLAAYIPSKYRVLFTALDLDTTMVTPFALDYIKWDSTEIVVRVPSIGYQADIFNSDTIPVFGLSASTGKIIVSKPDNNGIETTTEELEGFQIIRAIGAELVDPERIAIRDAKSYCAILLDDNNRRPMRQ